MTVDYQYMSLMLAVVGIATLLAQVLNKLIESFLRRNDRNGSSQQLDILKGILGHIEKLNVNQRETALILRERGKDIEDTQRKVTDIRSLLTDRERMELSRKIERMESVVAELVKAKSGQAA